MEPTAKIIQGNLEEEIWHQLEVDFQSNRSVFDSYEVVIQQKDKPAIYLTIEVDLGGGFEGGYESTSLVSQFELEKTFSFLIQRESFIVEIGKLLGMEDIEIGYPEFDQQVRIKTDDAARAHKVFQNAEDRELIQFLASYEFSLAPVEDSSPLHRLQLQMEEAIVEPERLKAIYRLFHSLILSIQAS